MNSRFRATIVGVAFLVTIFDVAQGDVLPIALLRRAQDIQDESAIGIAGASGRRDEIDKRLEASLHASPQGWTDRRILVGLASFLLTGGNPALAQRAISLAPREGADMSLVEQALAYVSGELPRAGKQLETTNLRMTSPEVAGALALVQARLMMEHDRRIASEKLLAARILAPGGLIEEAALRRELFILDNETDPNAIRRIVGRYFSRFGRSAHVENFVERLETLTEQGWISRSPEWRSKASGILEEAPVAIRRRLALRLARASLMKGDRNAARQALDIACADSIANADLEERCALYRRIDKITEGAPADDKKTPWQSSPTPGDEEQLLLQCAKFVRAQLEKAREEDSSNVAHPETEPMKRVKESMAAADRLIAGFR
jgi:chemotaxis protein MotC